MPRPFISLLVILCLLIAIPMHAQEQEIRIDPEQPMGAPAAKLFRSIRYIPLETTKESLFGRIDKLYVTDSFYIVLDNSTNHILLFHKDGRFHTRFSTGFKPEYGRIRTLKIDEKHRWITFRDYDGLQKTYDFNGRQLVSRKMEDGLSEYYGLKDDVEVRFRMHYGKKEITSDSIAHELKFYQNDSLVRMAFPYPFYNKVITDEDLIYGYDGVLFGSGNDSLVHLLKPYHYDVYAITPDTVSKAYRFIFPVKHTMPDDFLTSESWYGKRFKYVNRKNAKEIWCITSFYQIRNWAFFKLMSLGKPEQLSFNFMYNIDNGALFAIEHVAPDASNSYLPIGTWNGFTTVAFTTHSFQANDGTAVYASVTSQEMFAAKEAAKEKNIQYDEVMARYFNNSDRKSNPVILQMIPR